MDLFVKCHLELHIDTEWIFDSSTHIQYSLNSKEQNCVDWTERLKEHLQLP